MLNYTSALKLVSIFAFKTPKFSNKEKGIKLHLGCIVADAFVLAGCIVADAPKTGMLRFSLHLWALIIHLH